MWADRLLKSANDIPESVLQGVNSYIIYMRLTHANLHSLIYPNKADYRQKCIIL